MCIRDSTLGWLAKNETGTSSPLRKAAEFTGLLPAGGEQTLVKRVIGLGGDHVTCCTADGKLQAVSYTHLDVYKRQVVTRRSVVSRNWRRCFLANSVLQPRRAPPLASQKHPRRLPMHRARPWMIFPKISDACSAEADVFRRAPFY